MVIPCQDLSNFLKNGVFFEIYWGFFSSSPLFTFSFSAADEKSSMGHLFSWIIFSRRLPLCFIEVLNMTAFGIQRPMMAIIYKVEFHAFVKSYKYVTFHRSGHILIFSCEFAISIEVLFAFNKCIKFDVADNCHHRLLNTN